MGIALASNFDVNVSLPLDSRMTVADETARNAIPSGTRYEGMIVYVVGDLTNYQLVGGIADGNWTELSGSGGGGAAIIWEPDVSAPIYNFTKRLPGYNYLPGNAGQKLFASFKVPVFYSAGNVITMRSLYLSADSTTDTVLFQTAATLIRPGTDLVDSVTNVHTSTNAASAQSGPLANKAKVVVNDLTDTAGRINGVDVLPNDLIIIELIRAADTSTFDATFFHRTSEVTFV